MKDPSRLLEIGDALLVVDVQVDFLPGGSLGVEDGNSILEPLNQWLDAAGEAHIPVFASRDWHPPNHVSFAARDGPWPAHCVQGTPGARFAAALRLPENTFVISKGSHPDEDAYSAFDGTGLAAKLRSLGVWRLWVGGLAQEFCVLHTVLDGLQQRFAVHVICKALRPVERKSGDGERALRKMEAGGAALER